MYDNLLPIGSVVLLAGGNKRLMITNRIVTPGEPKEVFDYAGCPYPEGLADTTSFYFFNRDLIERVYFIGFQDEEELTFRAEVLGKLGELYVDENGQIVEREQEEAVAEPAAEPAAEVVEPAVFADV